MRNKCIITALRIFAEPLCLVAVFSYAAIATGGGRFRGGAGITTGGIRGYIRIRIDGVVRRRIGGGVGCGIRGLCGRIGVHNFYNNLFSGTILIVVFQGARNELIGFLIVLIAVGLISMIVALINKSADSSDKLFKLEFRRHKKLIIREYAII